ncbi:hypothetical protein D3C81_1854730 [compost metagenome]
MASLMCCCITTGSVMASFFSSASSHPYRERRASAVAMMLPARALPLNAGSCCRACRALTPRRPMLKRSASASLSWISGAPAWMRATWLLTLIRIGSTSGELANTAAASTSQHIQRLAGSMRCNQ